MSDRRIRIVPGPPIAAALRAADDETPTRRLNALAERYLAIIEALRPALSRAEWLAICDALDSAGIDDSRAGDDVPRVPAWAGIARKIADAPDISRWGVDQRKLAAKIAALPEPARVAIVETAQRFWALSHLSDSQALDLATMHPAMWPTDAEPR